jgi:hypothetical protein
MRYEIPLCGAKRKYRIAATRIVFVSALQSQQALDLIFQLPITN